VKEYRIPVALNINNERERRNAHLLHKDCEQEKTQIFAEEDGSVQKKRGRRRSRYSHPETRQFKSIVEEDKYMMNVM
jgi:hypothetical protein